MASKKLMKSWAGAMERANNKFTLFDELNKMIDSKVSEGMSKSEKLKLASDRDSARRRKAKLITQQTYVVKEAEGSGSAKGMHSGAGIYSAKGKQKVKKSPADAQKKW